MRGSALFSRRGPQYSNLGPQSNAWRCTSLVQIAVPNMQAPQKMGNAAQYSYGTAQD